MSRTAKKRGREAMTSYPDQEAGPRKEDTEATERFPHSQTEESGEGIWDAVQGNRGRGR